MLVAMKHNEPAPGSVFVIGAAGFIGEGIARAFSRNGYCVYGLIRKKEQAKELLLHDIIPVIGDGTDPATYKKYVEICNVIVDATLISEDHEAIPRTVFNIIRGAGAQDPIFSQKLFLYTSGIMVYDHDERIRDETWPLAKHVYGTWRTGVERFVLSAKDIVTAIVIRPGWVYGRRLGPHGQIFDLAAQKTVHLQGVHKDRRYSWVHVDDLGEAYVLAAKAGKRVAGEVFNIVGYDQPKYVDLLLKAGEILGHQVTIEWSPAKTESEVLRDASVVLNPQKAIDLLGWHPKIYGFLEHLERYYAFYTAGKE